MAGLTFKKQKRETGLAGVGNPYANVNIKHEGKVVGHIWAPNWQKSGWRVHFALDHGDGSFVWMRVNKEFETEESARLYVKDAGPKWIAKKLHHFESDYAE